MDGAWNSENWVQKLTDDQSKKEKSSEQKEKVFHNAPASNKGVEAAMEWANVKRIRKI